MKTIVESDLFCLYRKVTEIGTFEVRLEKQVRPVTTFESKSNPNDSFNLDGFDGRTILYSDCPAFLVCTVLKAAYSTFIEMTRNINDTRTFFIKKLDKE